MTVDLNHFQDHIRLELLRKACDQHQDYYRNAMSGHGIDRHLFALYIVSKYFQINSPFLDAVFGMTFALSTSQVWLAFHFWKLFF